MNKCKLCKKKSDAGLTLNDTESSEFLCQECVEKENKAIKPLEAIYNVIDSTPGMEIKQLNVGASIVALIDKLNEVIEVLNKS